MLKETAKFTDIHNKGGTNSLVNYQYHRIFGIVLDSLGIGEAPDAKKYNDIGADTLGHIGAYFGEDLKIPNLKRMGLGNVRQEPSIRGIEPSSDPLGYFGKASEVSVGKDSMDGHWEMMGVPVTTPLGFFPNGFPTALIDKIQRYSGRKVIVNQPYSGTEVIFDFGEEQLRTGSLIVYTSGDSVLQIAANTNVIPLDELYRICAYVRSITIDQYCLGRIIARPFTGESQTDFARTGERRDYTLEPPVATVLDDLYKAQLDVLGVGKINDIFSNRGISQGWHTRNNEEGMLKTLEMTSQDFEGFCFTNLVDFDALYGHRRDIRREGEALMAFDRLLGRLLEKLRWNDLLIITADHGNDPGFRGSDHTREFVPLLVYSPSMTRRGSLGVRKSFADFGATLLENFKISNNKLGKSFLNQLI